MNTTKYPKGLYYNLPHENAPDFVKGQINIANKHQLIEWLNEQQGDSVKLSLKQNKEGKGYAEIDTYEAKKQDSAPQKQGIDLNANFDESDSLPF